MMEKSKLATESPCIRNCCLDETDICLGCYRTLSEITSWSASTDEEKRAIRIQCNLREIAKKQNEDRGHPYINCN